MYYLWNWLQSDVMQYKQYKNRKLYDHSLIMKGTHDLPNSVHLCCVDNHTSSVHDFSDDRQTGRL